MNRRTTRSMAASKRAAKEPAAAGEECLKRCRRRKAEELTASDKSASTMTRNAAKIGSASVKGEVAAGKRMTRLPQVEVDSILATVMDDDRLPPDFRALKRHSPDLVPSPEEEMDEEMVSFYDVVREFYAVGEEFREFQAWVRSEYTKHGCVEVDDEFLAKRAEGRAVIEEARKEAIKGFDFSDLID